MSDMILLLMKLRFCASKEKNVQSKITFLALLFSFYCVLVFFQLLLCEIIKRVGGKGASVLLVLNDESLIEKRKDIMVTCQ